MNVSSPGNQKASAEISSRLFCCLVDLVNFAELNLSLVSLFSGDLLGHIDAGRQRDPSMVTSCGRFDAYCARVRLRRMSSSVSGARRLHPRDLPS
jgi:hypothetical protein